MISYQSLLLSTIVLNDSRLLDHNFIGILFAGLTDIKLI